jgi:hypothetical protein
MSSGAEQVFSEITCDVIMKEIFLKVTRPIGMMQTVLSKTAYRVD